MIITHSLIGAVEGNYSAGQSAISFSSPSLINTEFVIVTAGAWSTGSTNARYSVLANNVLTQVNTLITYPALPWYPVGNILSFEALTAIPTCNGTHYVVLREGSAGDLLVYEAVNDIGAGLVDFNFISATPTIIPDSIDSENYTCPSWFFQNQSQIRSFSNIKFSPDGKRLVYSSKHSGVVLYNFDVSTGILTFDQQLSTFATWGAQFSPNSDVLYASEQPPAICRTYGDIIQYDLNSLDIIGSRNIVAHGFRYRSMQEGPDGRIYVWRTDNPSSCKSRSHRFVSY